MRAVVDTNIFISALINPLGSPGQVIRRAVCGEFELCTSARIWSEVVRVLQRPKIRKVLERRGGVAAASDLLDTVFTLVTFVELRPPSQRWLEQDPDDDWVIQCALTAGARCVVTGDGPLLGLRRVADVEILDARSFLVWLDERTTGS